MKLHPQRDGAPDVAIRVEKLNKCYGSKQVLDNVSFSVKRSECFCLLGPNGAGKTTAMKIITGMLSGDTGIVEVKGMTITELRKRERGYITLIPQYANLDPLLTVEENLIFYGLLQKMRYKEIHSRVVKLLQVFEIAHLKKQVTHRCSGGEYQRLLVARAFLRPAEIIFMDEPTAGIDILFKNILWDYFIEEKTRGRTIYLNTHDLNEAEVLADRIGFLLHGKLIAIDTPSRLKSLVQGVHVSVKCSNIIYHTELFAEHKHTLIDDKTIVLQVATVDAAIIGLLERLSTINHILNVEITQPSLNDVFKKLGAVNASDTMA